jgi:hypothetical protein
MRKALRDAGHLIGPLVLFAVGVLIFLGVRQAVIPKNFGQYGHFRPGALAEIRDRPLHYAGRGACADCHSDVVSVKKTGAHAGIACETCHGPQLKHVEDPEKFKPALPDTVVLCARCHQQNVAKPHGFPQVAAQQHSQGMACKGCHQPHSPKL